MTGARTVSTFGALVGEHSQGALSGLDVGARGQAPLTGGGERPGPPPLEVSGWKAWGLLILNPREIGRMRIAIPYTYARVARGPGPASAKVTAEAFRCEVQ
jgi:hypothetical protein